MNINKRVIAYITVCYLFVSISLFSVFIYSYQYYFYKNQKQTVLVRSQASEKLFLKSIVEKIKSYYRTRTVESGAHKETLELVSKEKLFLISEALKAISDEESKKIEPISQEIEDPDFIFADVPEMENTISSITKPLNKKDSGGKFIQLFDQLNKFSSKGPVRIQRYSKGEFSKPVPISYMRLGETKIKLYNDGFEYEWIIRAFGELQEQRKINYEKVSDEIKMLDLARSKKLVIYESNNSVPVYTGEKNVVEFKRIEAIWKKAINTAESTYINENTEERVVRDDQEMIHITMYSILVDPELKITMALTKNIFETEWRQYSFFNRNVVPISVFAILAWFVFPLLAWLANIVAARFRFNYTLDLSHDEDSYEDEDNNLPVAKTSSFLTSPIPDWEEEDSQENKSEKNKIEDLKQKEKVSEKSNELRKVEENNGNDFFKAKINPFENFSNKELSKIRDNNIRKAKGVFKFSETEDVDYLEGVQSEVLRSLIIKLREDT